MSTLGLPRPVVNLLRHMEPHKDSLKWNITENSHKITLSLNWGFKKNKSVRETLWNKLQRTLKLGSGRSEDDPAGVPRHIADVIHSSPRKSAPPSTTHNARERPPLRRQNSLPSSRGSLRPMSRSHTLPATYNCSPASVIMPNSYSQTQVHTSSNRVGMTRQQSLPITAHRTPSSNAVSRQHSLHSMCSPSSSDNGILSGFSWPGASSPEAIRGPLSHSTPLQQSNSCDYDHMSTKTNSYDQLTSRTSSPCISRISPNTTTSQGSATRIRITYRTEDDIEKSLEDIMAKTREKTRRQLHAIRREWNRTIHDWDQMVDDGEIINISTDSTDDVPIGQNTVEKCLASCDNILYRNSTDIT